MVNKQEEQDSKPAVSTKVAAVAAAAAQGPVATGLILTTQNPSLTYANPRNKAAARRALH